MSDEWPDLDGIFGSAPPEEESADACQAACPPICQQAFQQVLVYPHIRGGTRVEWMLNSQFQVPPPHRFQLQVSKTGLASGDWTNVGLPVVDTFLAVDDQQRVFGKTQWTHYRLELLAGGLLYHSAAYPCSGALQAHDWSRWLGATRIWSDRLRMSAGGQRGYLLKVRHGGQPCNCLDLDTGEVTKPNHIDCYGTGYLGGYYPAVACHYAELDPENGNNKLDEHRVRGTVDDIVVQAKMLAYPQLFSRDYWVSKDTDVRYEIQQIQNLAEVRGVPVVVGVLLRVAPFSDVIYQFPVP